MEGRCGNGVLEEPEACDDGNDEDADGCNRDCTISGSPLWTVNTPNIRVYKIIVGSRDEVHAAGVLFEDGMETPVILTLAPDGTVLKQTAEPPVADAPAETQRVEVLFNDFELRSDGTSILGLTYVFRDANDELLGSRSDIVLEQDSQWSHSFSTSRFSFFFFIDDDENLYGVSGQDIMKLSPTGEVLFTFEQEHIPRQHDEMVGVRGGDGGLTLAEYGVARYDHDGSLLWSTPWATDDANPVFSSVSSLHESDDQAVYALGVLSEDLDDTTRRRRLVRFSADGRIEQEREWQAGESNSQFRLLVVTAQGHVVVAGGANHQLSNVFASKLNPDLSTRWTTEFGSTTHYIEAIDSDSAGAIITWTNGAELTKLAP